jgi:glycerophosphoryl diester phosphodiesterase
VPVTAEGVIGRSASAPPPIGQLDAGGRDGRDQLNPEIMRAMSAAYRAVLSVVVAVVLVVVVAGRAQATMDCTTQPATGAHRGAPIAGSGNTENGKPAFRAAWARSSVGYVEADFRRTKDHQILIMHDATIDRTTNGTGTLSAMTYAHAKTFHLDDGSAIPGEKTFLAGLRATGKGADMELKNLGPAAMSLFVSILSTYTDLSGRIRVTSLSTSQLTSFRSYAGKRASQWTTVLIPTTTEQVADAKAQGPFVQVFHPSHVATYAGAGLTVEATSTGASQWTTVTASPIERVLTNDPDGFRTWWLAACTGTAATTTAKDYPYPTKVED